MFSNIYIYFGESQFRRNRIFNFIISRIYGDKRLRVRWHYGRMGSVVECLTRDHGVAVSSLTGVTALWSLSKTHLS